MSITSRSIKHLRIAVSRLSRDKSTEPHYHRRCGLDLSLFEPCEEKTGLSPMDRPSHDSRGKAPQGFTGYTGVKVPTTGNYFHLHLVSDSTGETLITVARAVAAQYANVSPVEHVYPLVRSQKQLDRVLDEIEEAPGIVLFTLLEKDLVGRLEAKCKEINIPSLSIIGPVMQLFQAYLGAPTTGRVGAQHTLNAEYFKRIDALNYTMMHDDGQHVEGLEEADVVLVGVSRTSKTPTSIYLANRGVKTGNVPLVPGVPVAPAVENLSRPLVVGLYASPERIVQIRENRLLGLKTHRDDDQYIDRQAVAEEIAFSRRLCAKHNWPTIDVTRRSIEETAAAVLKLLTERRRQPAP